ncbi:tetratricopeptide (TPR) repeat protein [Chryseobacterium rhizosphaerae]|uniref:tetratricopeptide repeat protein n=1 Tax=Chryseobacterium rhizosphaerae TaxID=395937 RepID=UPI000648D7B6|nr:tetratricopeptide repeat protein [Chryseobacterium rhizosphaerae]MDR6544925.1 tetratricopeptide (TPR) repeat protein [Chryseobacterium rhizosphaerae]
MRKIKILTLLCIGSIQMVLGQSNFNLGFEEYRNDHFEKAISLFTKSINEKEKVIDSHLYRGMSYLYLENAIDSKKDLDQAFEIDSNYAKVYVFYGRYYSATNQFGKALENYNIALKKNPNDYILYSERAGAESMLELFNEALKDADIAVKHLPNEYNAYLNRGYVRMRMDKYTDAIDDFNKSLSIKKSHKGYGNRGTAYALLRKYDLALKDFDKALEYNPNDPLILYYQGEVLLSVGEKKKACSNFLKSKQLGNDGIDDVIQKAKCNE